MRRAEVSYCMIEEMTVIFWDARETYCEYVVVMVLCSAMCVSPTHLLHWNTGIKPSADDTIVLKL